MKAIITADWHLRADKPRCRLDEDWCAFQERIVEWIVKTANESEADLFIIGDIFDTPNVPAHIVTMLIRHLSKIRHDVCFLAGNHDLPYHSLDNMDSSAIGILVTAAERHPIIHHGMPCGTWQDFGGDEHGLVGVGNRFIHRLVFENSKAIPPNVNAITAQDLLDEYPASKWIFTGDMHQSFHYEKKGRHVVNPGCIIRQSADMISYEPSVYFINTDTKTIADHVVERLVVPDNVEMVTDSYIQEASEREDRIGAFIEGVRKNGAVSLSFIDNIEAAIARNKKLSKTTIKSIRELVEE